MQEWMENSSQEVGMELLSLGKLQGLVRVLPAVELLLVILSVLLSAPGLVVSLLDVMLIPREHSRETEKLIS
jgi:hypothetical protein